MEQMQHIWGDRRPITLNDIAREAGVSQSAASVVLNGARSGTRISALRRRAVLEAAERMGYRPNALARSLTTGRTHRIGLYSGRSQLDSRNSFFAELLGGVLDGAAENKQNTMVHSSGWGEDGLLDLVSNRALDGLVVHASDDDPIIPLLCELRVPAIAVADRIEGLPSVIVDDEAGGELQARHLASLGHRHVLLKQFPGRSGSSTARMESLARTLEKLGIRATLRYETFAENDGLDPSDIEILTEGPERATAIVGWSDHVAQRICNRLDRIGLSIPGYVSVVGFDGFTHSATPRHALTTIRAPWAQVGRQAVTHLNALIEGQSVPDITVIPVEFVRGDTT